MSRHITALGQHTLPIQDRKCLIHEIAKRFEANVYFGFYERFGLVEDDLPTFKSRGLIDPMEGSYSSTLFLLDEFKFSSDAKPFTLIEDDHEYRWIYDKFGEQAGYKKELIEHWSDSPIQNNSLIKDFITNPTSYLPYSSSN